MPLGYVRETPFRKLEPHLLRKGTLRLLATLAVMAAAFLLGRAAYLEIRYPVHAVPASGPIDVFREPMQETAEAAPIILADRKGRRATLFPRATYDIEARAVINRGFPRYDVDWPVGDLLTNDLVLAWGSVAGDKYLSQISFSHQFMYVIFKYGEELVRELGGQYISEHVSSNHLVGANENVANALRRIGKNEPVRISGYLIDIEYSGEPRIETSLTRTDNFIPGQGRGGGSEFIYVISVQYGGSEYR